VDKELESMQTVAAKAWFKVLLGICLEELRKTTKTHSG
jgi:hypothetical protein